MTLFGCDLRCRCTLATVVASVIVGVLTAFFQITGAVTVTTLFVWVVLGAAVAYLAVLVAAALLSRRTEQTGCACAALNTVLLGILAAIALALVLLAFGIVATSVVSAILVGALLAALTLTLAGSACLVRQLLGCAG